MNEPDRAQEGAPPAPHDEIGRWCAHNTAKRKRNNGVSGAASSFFENPALSLDTFTGGRKGDTEHKVVQLNIVIIISIKSSIYQYSLNAFYQYVRIS